MQLYSENESFLKWRIMINKIIIINIHLLIIMETWFYSRMKINIDNTQPRIEFTIQGNQML